MSGLFRLRGSASLAQNGGAVVDRQKQRAHGPAHGIGHRNAGERVAEEILDDEKVRLTEQHEGEQHQQHGDGTFAHAAQRAAVGLVIAHEEIEWCLQRNEMLREVDLNKNLTKKEYKEMMDKVKGQLEQLKK